MDLLRLQIGAVNEKGGLLVISYTYKEITYLSKVPIFTVL